MIKTFLKKYPILTHPAFIFSISVFLLNLLVVLFRNYLFIFTYSFENAFNEFSGILTLYSIGSLIISIYSLFRFRKHGWIILLPLVINLVTIPIVMIPQSKPSLFYEETHLVLPRSANNIQYFNDQDNFMGDGDQQFSFYASEDDIHGVLESHPFNNQDWKTRNVLLANDGKGCYWTQEHGDICDGTINKFWGTKNTLKFKDESYLQSATLSRSPLPQYPYANYTEVIVDPKTDWVLVMTHDS